MTRFIDRLVFDLVVICFSATAAAWFSTFLENAFVRRVKRRMLLRIERFLALNKTCAYVHLPGDGDRYFFRAGHRKGIVFDYIRTRRFQWKRQPCGCA